MPRGRAAEEIHHTAAAQHLDRPVPRLRLAHGLDHDVGAAAARQFAHRRDRVERFFGRDDTVRAQSQRMLQLRSPAPDGDHLRAAQFRQPHEHGSDRADADHGHRVACFEARIFQALHHACQRLGERGILVTQMRRDFIRVALHDARRDANDTPHKRHY